MKYNPDKHHRRSIRLKGYDYSQPGWYFVTICTQNREMLFGDVVDGKMVFNLFGKIIDYHWQKLPQHFKNIKLDEYQIMPNHFHGIIEIVGAMHDNDNENVGAKHFKYDFAKKAIIGCGNASPLHQQSRSKPHGTIPGSLGAIMQNFNWLQHEK